MINPDNVLRLLREGGPQTNKQLRTALGLPDALNEMGEALQALKRGGKARPNRPGGPVWQAEEGVRITATEEGVRMTAHGIGQECAMALVATWLGCQPDQIEQTIALLRRASADLIQERDEARERRDAYRQELRTAEANARDDQQLIRRHEGQIKTDADTIFALVKESDEARSCKGMACGHCQECLDEDRLRWRERAEAAEAEPRAIQAVGTLDIDKLHAHLDALRVYMSWLRRLRPRRA